MTPERGAVSFDQSRGTIDLGRCRPARNRWRQPRRTEQPSPSEIVTSCSQQNREILSRNVRRADSRCPVPRNPSAKQRSRRVRTIPSSVMPRILRHGPRESRAMNAAMRSYIDSLPRLAVRSTSRKPLLRPDLIIERSDATLGNRHGGREINLASRYTLAAILSRSVPARDPITELGAIAPRCKASPLLQFDQLMEASSTALFALTFSRAVACRVR